MTRCHVRRKTQSPKKPTILCPVSQVPDFKHLNHKDLVRKQQIGLKNLIIRVSPAKLSEKMFVLLQICCLTFQGHPQPGALDVMII